MLVLNRARAKVTHFMKKISLVIFVVVFSSLIPAKIAQASIFSDFVSSLKDFQIHLTKLVNITKNISSDDTTSCNTRDCPPVKLNDINLPELGVKLSVPNSLKDLKYLVATTSATSTSKTILLSSETLSDLDDNCTLIQASLGTLSLAHDYATTTSATTTITSKSKIKTGLVQVYSVGNKQIIYQNPQIYCSDNKLVQSLLTKQLKNLQDSLSTLAPLPAASSTPAVATSTVSVTALDLSASVILSQPATSTASTTGQ